jgi:hypothetical protein
MKRTLMQVYVKDSAGAVALYQRAFDAKVVCDSGPYHIELDVYGQIVAVSDELPKSFVVCERGGRNVVYLSQISPVTLKKRAGFLQEL